GFVARLHFGVQAGQSAVGAVCKGHALSSLLSTTGQDVPGEADQDLAVGVGENAVGGEAVRAGAACRHVAKNEVTVHVGGDKRLSDRWRRIERGLKLREDAL